jgi:Zn-dependent protease
LADERPACLGCGTELARESLSCPACNQLVHAPKLEVLAQEARTLEASGSSAEAAERWRQALVLLPPESKQAAAIRDRAASLGAAARLAGDPTQKPAPAWLKRFGSLGVAVAAFFSKFKFLLLGLGKFKTLLTMLASMGLYWSWFGWRFAVGFVLGIYVHEMGHVWALHRFGLRASAPMFIPGFGAFVSLYDSPANVGQDARIGLAGPLWGAGAALAFLLPSLFLPGAGLWLAIARATALINIFNLTPIWTLDGGRAFRALDRQQRLYLLMLLLALWLVTSEGVFLLLILGTGYRLFWNKDFAPEPDWTVFLQFAMLAALFGAMLAGISIRQ